MGRTAGRLAPHSALLVWLVLLILLAVLSWWGFSDRQPPETPAGQPEDSHQDSPAQEHTEVEAAPDTRSAVLPSSDAPPGIGLFVVGPNGTPVPDADVWTVWAEDEPSPSLLARTDDAGECTFPWEEARLLVSHSLYARQVVECPTPGTTARVVLQPGGVIRGRVLGTAPEAELRVFAADLGQVQDLRALDWRGLVGGASPHLATSPVDPDGWFEVRGLEVGRWYSVVGVGSGLLALPPAHEPGAGLPGPAGSLLERGNWIEAGTENAPGIADLEAYAYYGIVLTFQSSDGERLRVAHMDEPDGDRWLARVWVDTGCEIPGVEQRHRASYLEGVSSLVLSQVPGAPSGGGQRYWFWYEDGRYHHADYYLLRCGSEHLPEELPVVTQWRVEGYGQGNVTRAAVRGGFREEVIDLDPRHSRWGGELEVVFRGQEHLPEPAPGARSTLPYSLSLTESSTGELWRFSAPDRLPHRLFIRDVPQGGYDLIVGTLHDLFRHPAKGLHVDLKAEPQRIDLDLATTGALHIRVFEAGEERRTGGIGAALIKPIGGGKGMPYSLNLRDWPYVVPYLEPGPYYLWLETPAQIGYRDADVEPVDSILVVESSVTEVVFELP